MVSRDKTEGNIRPGDPPHSPISQDGIREGEPLISAPLISIPQSLLDAAQAFRAQILALGAAWIFVGLGSAIFVAIGLARTEIDGHDRRIAWLIAVIVGVAQVIWFPIGILTCLRKMWAVYCGLILSYLVLFSPLFHLGISIVVGREILWLAAPSIMVSLIFVLLLLQGHRVISLANRLHEEGIP